MTIKHNFKASLIKAFHLHLYIIKKENYPIIQNKSTLKYNLIFNSLLIK